ncbi:MAG: prepilin-type N-terminal cleavage/methylation domain-containing protein [Candidatus Paceibacterota bacterium]
MSRFINLKQNKGQEGFTLIETLVAISILLTVLVSAYSAAQTSIRSSNMAKDRVVAFFLAQDAFEHVENIRMDNACDSSASSWLDGVDQCTGTDRCGIDVFQETGGEVIAREVAVFDESITTRLYKHSVSGVYDDDSGWDPTPFSREVWIEGIVSGEEAVVHVEIEGPRGADLRLRKTLFNWPSEAKQCS